MSLFLKRNSLQCLCMFRHLDLISVKTSDFHGVHDGGTAHHNPIYSRNIAYIAISVEQGLGVVDNLCGDGLTF